MGGVLVPHNVSCSTGMTPFQVLYGCPPPPIPAYELGSSVCGEIDEQMAARDDLLAELKQHLVTANNRMKQQADSRRRDVSFQVGDWVLLRIPPYRKKLCSVAVHRSSHTVSMGPSKLQQNMMRWRIVSLFLKVQESNLFSTFHYSNLGLETVSQIWDSYHLCVIMAN